ncbi:MAG: 50S ribosomal protein L29 [Verrucomicrobiaceae bacterium]
MSKVREIREMSDEQIRLVWKDAAEALFKLRLQAQTEKIAAPSEVQKTRRTIARCQTILAQRGSPVVPTQSADGTVPAVAAEGAHDKHDKHAKNKKLSGRAKVQASGKEGVVQRKQFKKRTQSGT